MAGQGTQVGFLNALLGAQSTNTTALTAILDTKVNIPSGLRSRASDSHNSLREFLRGENGRDETFPAILAGADFIGGSFGRHTKIWPLDDIDLYFPLDGVNLIYVDDNRCRLPYVLDANQGTFRNPVLGPRWAVGGLVSSSKLIRGFSDLLSRRFPRTRVRPNEQSVSVQMTHGAGEESDGLGYDIVPCFSLSPDAAEDISFYLIPDGRNGWIRTNPKVDNEIADSLQRFHNGHYRAAVKLMKYWNVSRLGGVLGSYYLELALMYRFCALKGSQQPVASLSEAIAISFEALAGAVARGDQQHYIKSAPVVRCAALTDADRVKIKRAHDEVKHVRLLEAHNQSEVPGWWSYVFAE
jgi:hypothetical protein